MSEAKQFLIITFSSTHHALKAEKILKKADIPAKVIPVPRDISSDCGVALRFEKQFEDDVKTELNVENIEIAGIYPMN